MNRFNDKRNSKLNISGDAVSEVSVGLHIDSRRRVDPVICIIRFVIAVLVSLSSLMCFVSALYPSEKMGRELLCIIGICAVCFAASMLPNKIGRGIAAALCAVIAAAVWKLRERAAFGFMLAANKYLSTVRQMYRGIDFFDMSDYTGNASEDVAVLFCIAAAVIALVSGLFIIYRTGFFPMFAATFILPEVVLYYGLVPDYIWVALLLACWAASGAAEIAEFPVSGKDRRLPVYTKLSGQSAAFAAVIVVIAFAFSTVMVDVSKYTRSQGIEEFKTRFSGYIRSFSWDKFMNDLDLLNPLGNDVSGAINHGKLGRTDTIEFNNETVLNVTLPKSSGNTYLKGFTGADYTGNSWKELSDEAARELEALTESFSTEALSPMFLDGYSWSEFDHSLETVDITVNNVSAGNRYSYLPYFITPEASKSFNVSADRVIPEGRTVTAEVFLLPSYIRWRALSSGWFKDRNDTYLTSEQLHGDELMYRSFVYDNYLDIPDTFTAAKAIYGATPMLDIPTELYNIKQWLDINCEYDLEAGKLPFGEDFAQYFLTKSRKGSCSHFASAAALMCRYRGIPARYCEGYIIKSGDYPADADIGDEVLINITDTRAHAWIEVYFDGYGWYPYEVTPGYGDTELRYEPQEQENDPENNEYEQGFETQTVTEDAVSETSASETADAQTETEVITETEPPAPEAEEETTEAADEPQTPDVQPPEQGKRGGLDLRWLLKLLAVLLIIAAVVFAVIMRRRSITEKRMKALKGRNTKEKAYSAVMYFMSLCRYMGIEKQDGMSYDDFAAYAQEKLPQLEKGAAAVVIAAGLAASYGNDPPDREEAEKAAAAVRRLARAIYNEQKPLKRIYFRYILCLY